MTLSWVPGLSWLSSPEPESPARKTVSFAANEKPVTRPLPSVYCARPGCNLPPWNGREGDYCSRACRERGGRPVERPDPQPCGREGCNRPAIGSDFCSRLCEAKARSAYEGIDSSGLSDQSSGQNIAETGNGAPSLTSTADTPALAAAPQASGHMTIMTKMSGNRVAVVAFSYGGDVEKCDRVCQAEFLGLRYDVGDKGLLLEAPCLLGDYRGFRTAEAAFFALKFWDGDPGHLSHSVTEKEVKLAVEELRARMDFSHEDHAGFGDEFQGMMGVLRAKFRSGTPAAAKLLDTGEAFLLCHHQKEDWGDAIDGSGTNWLGMQLMLIRDELRGSQEGGRWTHAISMLLDVRTGKALSDVSGKTWHQAVQQAARAYSIMDQKLQALGQGQH